MSLNQSSVIIIITTVLALRSTAQQTGSAPYECSSNQFQCGNYTNSTNCINLMNKCDGSSHCPKGEDEEQSACTGQYSCQLMSTIEQRSVSGLIEVNQQSGTTINEGEKQIISEEEAKAIIKASEGFSTSGVDIQDPLTLMALLLMNIVISSFIIIGLGSYHEKKHFQHIDISYIVIIIISLEQLLLSSVNKFKYPPIYCTLNGQQIASPFDILQYLLSMALWLLWVKYFYIQKAMINKRCCSAIVAVFTFIIPSLAAFLGLIITVRGPAALTVFTLSQIAIPIIWLLVLMEKANKLNGGCRGCIVRPCGNILLCQHHGIWYGIGSGICCLQSVIWLLYASVFFLVTKTSNFNYCMANAALVWFNPIWVVINIILLFSSARLPAIMYNLIMLSITLFGIQNGFICNYVINFNFVIHGLFIPIYVVVTFYSVQELSVWKMDVIHMYLVAFDVITDIIVIQYFIDTKEYIFAVLVIIFIVFGQIVGSFSEYCVGDKTEHFIVSTMDKIIAALGFSGPWFIVKSWSDRKYYRLQHKHQIWEIMFESVPAVALQIYAAITQKEVSTSLVISIIVTAATITFSIWKYLIKLTRLRRETWTTFEDNKDQNVELKVAAATNQNTETLPHGWRTLATADGKPYYQNDITKQTQWTKPVAPPPDALPPGWCCILTFDGRIYYQNDRTKQTQWEKPVVDAMSVDEKDDAETDGNPESDDGPTIGDKDKMMTTEQFVFEKGMEQLESSKIPKIIRDKFAPVLIYKTLFMNLYFFMMSDFYIRSMSIVIFISSIPCDEGAEVCVMRICGGSALFFVLLIFAFVMNKRMRIESYQSYGFISIIFAVSLLSSFYNILSSLKILKNDTFFGKSVRFESFLLEHKMRVWISFSINIMSIALMLIFHDSLNWFIASLMVLFFVALAINYFSVTKVARYIDSKKRYAFNLFACKETFVIVDNKEEETKENGRKEQDESTNQQPVKSEDATEPKGANSDDHEVIKEKQHGQNRNEDIEIIYDEHTA